MAEFDPERILSELGAHGVKFVVIGGLAGSLHGSPHATFDLDITPSRHRENLVRLADALRALGARIRVDEGDGGLAFDCSADFLGRVDLLNLTTVAGDMDIAFVPTGTEGYDDLAQSAITVVIRDTTFDIASLDDIIRSKQAADRPKDRLVLPALRALQRHRES